MEKEEKEKGKWGASPNFFLPNIFGIWMDVSGSILANFWSKREVADLEKKYEQG